jgi:hypothetical protein
VNYTDAQKYFDAYYFDIPGFGKEYDTDFFAGYNLGLFYIELTSGSQTVTVTATSIDEVWHKARVDFEIFVPRMGTEDMSGTVIAAAVPKDIVGMVYTGTTVLEDTLSPEDSTPQFLYSGVSADYGKEQAAKDGVYVNIQSEEVFNLYALERFREAVNAETSSSLRTMIYTTEGAPILTEYIYDGWGIWVMEDRSMDKFAGDVVPASTEYYGVLKVSEHMPVNFAEGKVTLSSESSVFADAAAAIAITLRNGLDTEIAAGDSYTVEYQNAAGVWNPIPLDIAFDLPGIVLKPGESRDFEISLRPDQYEYAAGEYRIRKPYSVNHENRAATFDFFLTQ